MHASVCSLVINSNKSLPIDFSGERIHLACLTNRTGAIPSGLLCLTEKNSLAEEDIVASVFSAGHIMVPSVET